MRALRILSVLAAVSAFYLLVAGAHVHAYQAALSVPDWPLSYGHILAPEWPGNVFYEQHHRATAASTMVLFAAVLIGLARRRELLDARWWGWRAGGALAIQVLMGGLIVLALNPPWLSVAHTPFAVATVVLIAATALALLDPGRGRLEPVPAEDADPTDIGRLRRRAGAAAGIVLLQVTLGALTRHAPLGEVLYLTTLMAHLFVAALLLMWLTLLAMSAIRTTARRWGWLLLVAVGAQLALGAWLFVYSPEPLADVWPPPAGFANVHAAHLVTAALVVTCLVAIRMRARSASRGDTAA